MALGDRGLRSRVSAGKGAGGGAAACLRLSVLGSLMVAPAGLFWSPGVLPAASEGQNVGAKSAPNGGPNLDALKEQETRISPDDLLFIQVFDVDQMTREYRVSGTGTVDFPLISEPISVAGMSPEQAAQNIAKKCIEAGVLTHPQISVTVRESRVHSVAISGAVKSPQIVPVFGHIRLLDLIAQGGGVADDAGSLVTISRGEVSQRVMSTGNSKSSTVPPTETINIQRLQQTGDQSLNVDIYPGDHVTVQRAGIVFVLGAVNRAGGYTLSEARQDMTVLKAVALAGDLKSTAKSKNTIILRPNPSAPKGREEIPIDLKAMLRGHIADRPLLSNDILFVPDSTLLKAFHRGADIGGMAAAYAAVYSVAP